MCWNKIPLCSREQILVKSENIQHGVDSFKLLQNEYNFTMKNISKYLLDGQLNILFGSYRDIFCRQPVGGMFIQEAILPSSKEEERCTQRWKEEEVGGKGQSMNFARETNWCEGSMKHRTEILSLLYLTLLDQGVYKSSNASPWNLLSEIQTLYREQQDPTWSTHWLFLPFNSLPLSPLSTTL